MFTALTAIPAAHGHCTCFGTHRGSVERITFACDILSIITLLVVGILGFKGTLPMPIAGAYACIGASIALATLIAFVGLYTCIIGMGGATSSLLSSASGVVNRVKH